MREENIKILKEVTKDNLEKVTITIPKQLTAKEIAILKEHSLEEFDGVDLDLETGLMTLKVAYESYYKGEW